MSLLVQTPRGVVSLPPQGFFQTQSSPFADQLTSRGVPFVPAQSRNPRIPPAPVATVIEPAIAPLPPLLRPVIRDDFTDSGYDPDPDDFFSGNIPGLLGDAVSAVGDKLGEATKNPLATIANFAFGFVPGVGWVNSASNFFGGPNIGDLLFGNDDRDEPPSDPPGVPTGPPSDPTGSDYASANNPEDKEGDELDIAPGGESPSDDDGLSFICTAAWDTGISGAATWQNNKRMYAWVRKNDPDTYAGYKKFGPWVAKRVRSGRWQWAAKIYPQSWAYEIALRTGKDTSDFPLWVKIENRLQRIFLRPIVRLWGKA